MVLEQNTVLPGRAVATKRAFVRPWLVPRRVRRAMRPWFVALPAVIVVLLIVAMAPLYICMPPWVDIAFFDMCARTALDHRPVYQEIFLHGPPGMLLIQALVRSVLGWRSEALRGLDLVIVLSLILWLARTVPQRSWAVGKLWTAVILCIFYFGATSEWSHCQPDIWMLVPSIMALGIHRRRWAKSDSQTSSAPIKAVLGGLAEGVCWGVAFTIKPFAIVPAAACWAVTTVAAWRIGWGWKRWLGDFATVLGGGMLVGVATVVWLVLTANWHAFIEGVMSDWNWDYLANSPTMRQRPGLMMEWFWPWNLIHLVAVPAAIGLLAHVFTGDRRRLAKRLADPMVWLAVLYLGWFFQANVLQRQLPYHLAPTILLAIPLVIGVRWMRWLDWLILRANRRRIPRRLVTPWLIQGNLPQLAIVVGFLCVASWFQTGIRADRLHWWSKCWREGSTPLMRARLALEYDLAAPDWTDLAIIRRWLIDHQVRDLELNCYAVSAMSLYPELGVRSATRFVYGWGAVSFFRHHTEEIISTMLRSPQRYIVNDFMQLGYDRMTARQTSPQFPRGWPLVPRQMRNDFPWQFKGVFRSGRYLVHEVTDKSPVTPLPAAKHP